MALAPYDRAIKRGSLHGLLILLGNRAEYSTSPLRKLTPLHSAMEQPLYLSLQKRASGGILRLYLSAMLPSSEGKTPLLRSRLLTEQGPVRTCVARACGGTLGIFPTTTASLCMRSVEFGLPGSMAAWWCYIVVLVVAYLSHIPILSVNGMHVCATLVLARALAISALRLFRKCF